MGPLRPPEFRHVQPLFYNLGRNMGVESKRNKVSSLGSGRISVPQSWSRATCARALAFRSTRRLPQQNEYFHHEIMLATYADDVTQDLEGAAADEELLRARLDVRPPPIRHKSSPISAPPLAGIKSVRLANGPCRRRTHGGQWLCTTTRMRYQIKRYTYPRIACRVRSTGRSPQGSDCLMERPLATSPRPLFLFGFVFWWLCARGMRRGKLTLLDRRRHVEDAEAGG